MFIDTHLHLCDRWCGDVRRSKAIADIDQNKIITWVQSWDIPSYEHALEYCKQSDYLFTSFGVLPWEAFDYKDRFDEIAELCKDAIMLGEIGWDERNAPDKRSYPYQKPMLEVFLEAAEKHDLILNLHFRWGLEKDGFELLKSYDSKRVIFHEYSGSIEMINKVTDQGFFISFGASNFGRLPDSAYDFYKTRVPLVHEDFLIIELDVLEEEEVFRPPSKVFPILMDSFAEFRNTSPEEIEAMNQRNVLRLIGNDPKLEKMRKLIEEKTKEEI